MVNRFFVSNFAEPKAKMRLMKRLHINTIFLRLIAVAATAWVMASCSSTKHVPEGQYLLDDVKFNITDNASR